MTEFGSEWPGWQLYIRHEDLLERVGEPLGGLVLVETGVDAHTLIHAVAERVDEIAGSGRSEASIYFSYSRDSSGVKHTHTGRLLRDFPDQHERMDAVYQAAYGILGPLEEAFMPNPPVAIGVHSLFVMADRRRQLRPTHKDFGLVTMWLGASRPALQVMHRDTWLEINDVPVGYALIWRGSSCEADGVKLPPVRHYARYRSVTRRVVALA